MTKKSHNSKTQTQEDLLSSLTDALLTHILSFVPTKDSICTSVLSTRWKFLFASVPALDFHFDTQNYESFAKFVNKILLVHNVSCIRSFRLFVDTPRHAPDLCSWISAAIRRNAPLLEVFISGYYRVIGPLPNELFTSQSLVHLKLAGNFEFDRSDPVFLPSLKSFNIHGCKFIDGDSARRLFSSCPVLENLTIHRCHTDRIKVFSIFVPSLKSLTIHSRDDGCKWELNVPNLEYICCRGETTKWYSVISLQLLKKAEICLENNGSENDDKILELVNKFEEVQFLSLSGDSMESLAMDSFSLPMFNKLTILELRVSYCKGWIFFRMLLERSPCLEKLVIREDGFMDHDKFFPSIAVLLPKHVPICFSCSLKEVKICSFEGDIVEFEWVRYLLKNANLLDKLTIFVRLLVEEDEEYFAYLERKYVIGKKLLSLPRGSSVCEIVVREE